MPKLKTHKGTKRRFHISANGKFLRPKGSKSHLRRRKAGRAKRVFSEMLVVDKSAVKRLRRLLPYGLR